MRLRKVKNAELSLKESKYYIENPEHFKGQWANIFNNNKPIHLEIGCGKGDFLIQKAIAYPDLNFIGVEKYESVLIRAILKMKERNLPNIRFILVDANRIDQVFLHEIETLYLNFSDPWPKKRHEGRRLTSPAFLINYELIFKKFCHIIQKTDNIQLFAYSLEQYSQQGYILEKVSLDLAMTKIENFETEYEHKFKELGMKINYVEVRKERK